MAKRSYSTPEAFRQALDQRIRRAALAEGTGVPALPRGGRPGPEHRQPHSSSTRERLLATRNPYTDKQRLDYDFVPVHGKDGKTVTEEMVIAI